MPFEKNITFIKRDSDKTEVVEKKEAEAYLIGFRSVFLKQELRKPEKMKKQIKKAIKLVADMAKVYEVSPFKLDYKMYHLFPHEIYKKKINYGDDSESSACVTPSGIFIDEEHFRRNDDLRNFMILLHETIHASAVSNYICVDEEKHFNLVNTRSGFGINNQSGRKIETQPRGYLEGLNEAITQYLAESIYVHIMRDMPEFADQIKMLEQDQSPEDKKKRIIFPEGVRAYFWLENLLFDLVEAIYKKNKDKFKDEKEVMSAFVKIYFNGRIKQLGELIMKLGPGALRQLNAIGLTDEQEDCQKIYEFRKKFGLPEDKFISLTVNKKKDDKQ